MQYRALYFLFPSPQKSRNLSFGILSDVVLIIVCRE